MITLETTRPWGDTQTVQVTCSLSHSRSDPGLSCQCVSVFLHTINPITAPTWNSIQNQRSSWQAFIRYKCGFLGSTRLQFSSSVIQYLCCWSSGELRCQMFPECGLLNDLKIIILKKSDLNNCRNTISQSINKLSVWSKD